MTCVYVCVLGGEGGGGSIKITVKQRNDFCTGIQISNILSLVPCQDCRVPHKDCLVCQAYFKVYDNEFLQYRFGPDRQLRSSSTPSLTSYHTPARARLPDSAPTSDDVAYSRPLSERKKIFGTESEGYSSYKDSSSHSDEMHERVKKLLEKTKVYSVSLFSTLFASLLHIEYFQRRLTAMCVSSEKRRAILLAGLNFPFSNLFKISKSKFIMHEWMERTRKLTLCWKVVICSNELLPQLTRKQNETKHNFVPRVFCSWGGLW